MKLIGGPVIRTFIHTETQDGKSLLDAHFAHATALIKRYLRRVNDNQLNKVTSASEIVEALSSRGGLQNCGTQLVSFDSDVCSKLDDLAGRFGDIPNKMKEYFSRANEITYFPEEDSECGKKFELHVKAYSNVSPGLRMRVDLKKGTLKVTGDGAKEGENEEESDEASLEDQHHDIHSFDLDPDDIEGGNDGGVLKMSSPEDQLMEEEEEELHELMLDTVLESESEVSSEKRLRSTAGIDAYCSLHMVTGVKVLKYMPFGEVLSTKKVASRKPKQIAEDGTAKAWNTKDVLSRGVQLLKSEAYTQFGIRRGMDDDVPEFQLARGFQIPSEFKKTTGWARRPDRGKMYGQKYIGPYKAELVQMFKRGSDNSDEKMGPSVMLEELRRRHPGIYTLPNFVEIQAFVSQCFSREKKNLELLTFNETTGEPGRELRQQMYDDAISRIVHQYGGFIKPKWVGIKLEKQFPRESHRDMPSQTIIAKAATKKSNELKKKEISRRIG